MSRIGKIARLPRNIRDQLNRRLLDGESGRQLVDWLNALPQVISVLRHDFDARPINEPNLTDWKQGGYREWLVQQEALDHAGELAANAGELNGVAPGLMSDHLATVLTARYAAELAALNDAGADESRVKLRALSGLCRDVVELQRGNHDAARVKIEQARLERDRDKSDEDVLDYFLRWLEYPKVWNCISDQSLTPDDRRKRLRDLFLPKPGQISPKDESASGGPPSPHQTPAN